MMHIPLTFLSEQKQKKQNVCHLLKMCFKVDDKISLIHLQITKDHNVLKVHVKCLVTLSNKVVLCE